MTRWGSARVEFVTLWPDIRERVATGEPLAFVYRELVVAGRTSMSARAFYKYCLHFGGPRRRAAPGPSSPSSPSTSPSPVTSPVTSSVPAPATPAVTGASAVPVSAGPADPSSLTATWTETPGFAALWGNDDGMEDAKTLSAQDGGAQDGDAKDGDAITHGSGSNGTEGGDTPSGDETPAGDGSAPAGPAAPDLSTDPD